MLRLSIIIIFVLMGALSTQAQKVTKTFTSDPVFSGDYADLKTYLLNEVIIPDEMITSKAWGSVRVRFTIKPDGMPANPRVTKHLNHYADSSSLEIVRIMARWTPAKRNGVPVAKEVEIEIPFTEEVLESQWKSTLIPGYHRPPRRGGGC